VLTRPWVAPCMRFLFVGSQVLPPASFPRSVALPQLPLAHSFIHWPPVGDLNPISSRPCWAYTTVRTIPVNPRRVHRLVRPSVRQQIMKIIAAFLGLLVLTSCATHSPQQAFLDKLGTLPSSGDFHTDEAVASCSTELPTIISLTERDLRLWMHRHGEKDEEPDIYPIAALLNGLCQQETNREYFATHFPEIRYPDLKTFCAALLFNQNQRTPAIIEHLHTIIVAGDPDDNLRDMTGPEWETFKNQVRKAAESGPRD